MLRLSKSSRLSAIHLITLLALPAASQDVIWEFPTSGTLFGVTLNYHDVVIAKWTSTWDNATIYAWAPQNATQQYPVSWLSAVVPGNGTYAFSFGSAPHAATYGDKFPFQAHFELSNGSSGGFVRGVDGDVFRVTSSPAAPRTYALSRTIIPTSTTPTTTPMSTSTPTTTPTSSPSPSSSPDSGSSSSGGSSGISGGAIAGIVIGVLVLIGILVAGGVFFFLRSRRRRTAADAGAEKLATARNGGPDWPRDRSELDANGAPRGDVVVDPAKREWDHYAYDQQVQGGQLQQQLPRGPPTVAGSEPSELAGSEPVAELHTPRQVHEMPGPRV